MVYLGRAIMFCLVCSFFAIIYIGTREREQDQASSKLFLLMWHAGVPTNLAVIATYAYNTEFFTIKKEVSRLGPWLLCY